MTFEEAKALGPFTFAEIQISLKKKVVTAILLNSADGAMPTLDCEMTPEMVAKGLEGAGDHVAVSLCECGMLTKDSKYLVVDLDAEVTN